MARLEHLHDTVCPPGSSWGTAGLSDLDRGALGHDPESFQTLDLHNRGPAGGEPLATLVQVGGLTEPTFPCSLGARSYVLGRSADADIRLEDRAVSRRHAEVQWSDAGFVLVDAGGRNPIRVNGRPETRHELADGDEIRIGTTVLRYQEVDPFAIEPATDRDAGRSGISLLDAGCDEMRSTASERSRARFRIAAIAAALVACAVSVLVALANPTSGGSDPSVPPRPLPEGHEGEPERDDQAPVPGPSPTGGMSPDLASAADPGPPVPDVRIGGRHDEDVVEQRLAELRRDLDELRRANPQGAGAVPFAGADRGRPSQNDGRVAAVSAASADSSARSATETARDVTDATSERFDATRSTPGERARRLLDDASRAFEVRRFVAAREKALEASAADPDARFGVREAAGALAQRATRTLDEAAAPSIARARDAVSRDDLEAADAALREALSIHPASQAAKKLRAEVAQRLESEDQRAFMRGEAFLAIGDVATARQEFESLAKSGARVERRYTTLAAQRLEELER